MVVALDFETANSDPGSICAVGLTFLGEDGQLCSRGTLVRPPRACGWFSSFNIAVHHITPAMVREAPEWGELWPELAPRLEGATLLAHNAAFDLGVLRRGLELYGFDYPTLDFFCTCKSARRVWPELPDHRLDTVAAHIGHHFRHHDAREDAEAAARAFLAMLRERNCSSCAELAESVGIRLGRLYPGGWEPCNVVPRRNRAAGRTKQEKEQ